MVMGEELVESEVKKARAYVIYVNKVLTRCIAIPLEDANKFHLQHASKEKRLWLTWTILKPRTSIVRTVYVGLCRSVAVFIEAGALGKANFAVWAMSSISS